MQKPLPYHQVYFNGESLFNFFRFILQNKHWTVRYAVEKLNISRANYFRYMRAMESLGMTFDREYERTRSAHIQYRVVSWGIFNKGAILERVKNMVDRQGVIKL